MGEGREEEDPGIWAPEDRLGRAQKTFSATETACARALGSQDLGPG